MLLKQFHIQHDILCQKDVNIFLAIQLNSSLFIPVLNSCCVTVSPQKPELFY